MDLDNRVPQPRIPAILWLEMPVNASGFGYRALTQRRIADSVSDSDSDSVSVSVSVSDAS